MKNQIKLLKSLPFILFLIYLFFLSDIFFISNLEWRNKIWIIIVFIIVSLISLLFVHNKLKKINRKSIIYFSVAIGGTLSIMLYFFYNSI